MLVNLGEILDDPCVAVNVLLEDLPVVDARLPRRAGVEQHEALVHFVQRRRDALAAGRRPVEMNGVDAAVHGGIVVLAAGGNADQLRFDVLRDHADLLHVEVTVEKRASAAPVAIISADEPEMPAPAGDSECVSSTNPACG